MTAAIVNVTIGGGLFLLPAVVAASLGSASWLAYVICAVAFALIMLCFAEAGSRVSMSGGPYGYVETAFGPFAGYITGVLVMLLGIVAHAAVASGFMQAVNAIVPGAGVGVPRAAILVLVFGLFAVINLRGVRQGARMIEAGAIAKLLPLLFFFVFGLFAVQGANLAWTGMPDSATLGRMCITLIFAFFGVESALVPSGEVREPARTVPRAILYGIGAVTVLYIGIQTAAQGILGADLPRYNDAPLAAAAGKAYGAWAGTLLLAGAAISMLGHNAGMMLAMPRQWFAFARDGYFPSVLASVNPVTHVPTWAIVTHAVVTCAIAISGTFAQLAVFANISAMLMYLLCCLAVLGLRRKAVRMEQAPFVVPGGPLVPVLASAAIIVLLIPTSDNERLAIAIALAVASVLYAARRAGQSKPVVVT